MPLCHVDGSLPRRSLTTPGSGSTPSRLVLASAPATLKRNGDPGVPMTTSDAVRKIGYAPPRDKNLTDASVWPWFGSKPLRTPFTLATDAGPLVEALFAGG